MGINVQSTQIISHLPNCTHNHTLIHAKPNGWMERLAELDL